MKEIRFYKALAVSVINTAKSDLRSGNKFTRDRALRFFTANPEETTLWLWLTWLGLDYTGHDYQQLKQKAVFIYENRNSH